MSASNLALARFGAVTVRLAVELGRTQMPLKSVLSLTEGSVVTLDRLTDELLDVTANGRVVAQGEVVAQDGRFALRIVNLVGEDAAPAVTMGETETRDMAPDVSQGTAAQVINAGADSASADAAPSAPPAPPAATAS